MFLGALRDSGRAIASSWWRLLLVQAIFAVALTVVFFVLGVVLAAQGTALYDWVSEAPATVEPRIAVVGVLAAVVVALAGSPLVLLTTATLARLIDTSLSGQRPRMWRAVGAGVRLVPRLLLAGGISVLGVALAFVAAPFVSVLGIVALVVVGIRSLLRRRRGRPDATRWRRWLVLAVPFGLLWRVLPTAVLLVPAALLEPAWPRAALTAAEKAATGRRWRILGAWLPSLLVTLALVTATGLIAQTLDATWGSLLSGVVPLVIAPLPLVVAVALYRRAAGPSGRIFRVASPVTPSMTPVPSPLMARVATAVVMALVLPLGAATTGSAAIAQDAVTPVTSFTVTSAADTTDATALASQKASCLAGTGDCTLRAALAGAADVAASGAPRATITISGAPVITLAAPLRFEPDALTTGGGSGGTGGGESPGTGEDHPIPTPAPSETTPSETTPAPAQTENPSEGGDPSPTSSETPAPAPTPEPSASEAPSASSTSELGGAVMKLASNVVASAQPTSEESRSQEPGSGTGGGGTSAITSGTLEIIGNGAVIDGGGTMRLLWAASDHWALSMSDITLRGGFDTYTGGALIAAMTSTTLTRTVFRGNQGGFSAGAVFARALTVDSSTFLDNTLSLGSEGSRGAAIYTTGATTIVNSTFGRNKITDQWDKTRNQGADVWADAGMTVVNSTFVDFDGGSLGSPSTSTDGGAVPTSTVRNSLFSTNAIDTPASACSGRLAGDHNAHAQGDGSCPGSPTVNRGPSYVGALDETGAVPVYPLGGAQLNVVAGTGIDCPSVDARGRHRPAQGCDLGAVQFDGSTTLSASAEPDADVRGSATFRATVRAITPSAAQGTVTFTVDGATYGPIALTQASIPNGITDTAVVQVPGLKGGASYDYSAVFTGSSPYTDSASITQTLTIAGDVVAVALACAPETPRAACSGADWTLEDATALTAVVSVADDQPGTVVLSSDAAGKNVVAGPVAVAEGAASFSLSAATIGVGRHALWAVYTRDDASGGGATSSPQTLLIRSSATVTLSFPAPTAVYGDPVGAAATVTVSGRGPVPTGTVSVGGYSATLDAQGHAVVEGVRYSWGVDSFAATYLGDEVYGRATSDTAGLQLTAAETTTAFESSSPSSVTAGLPFTTTVVVDTLSPSTATPSGALTLLSDGVAVTAARIGVVTASDTRAVYTVVVPGDALAVGEHVLTAAFSSGSGFSASTSAAQPVRVLSTATTTALQASSTAVRWDDSVSFTATVTTGADARTPSGSVEFVRGSSVIGSVALAACATGSGCATATFTAPAGSLGVGGGAVTARYVGSPVFAGSASTAIDVTVARATPTLTVDAPDSVAYSAGAPVEVKLAASGLSPETATVTLRAVSADGATTSLGSLSLATGLARVRVGGALLPGSYTLVADFGGDERFGTASTSRALSVTTAPTGTTLDTDESRTLPWNTEAGVGVSVKNLVGDDRPDGVVIVTLTNIEVGRVTLSSADDTGVAGERHVVVPVTFGAQIPSLAYSGALTASFEPTGPFAGSSARDATGSLAAQKITLTPRETQAAVTATAQLGGFVEAVATVSVPGAPAGFVARGAVRFVLTGPDGRDIGDETATLENGVAKLSSTRLGGIRTTSLGWYTVSVSYLGQPWDDRYVAPPGGSFAFDKVQVFAGAPTFALTAPTAVQVGSTLSVPVTMSGTVTPSGTIRIRSADNLLGDLGATVPLENGSATATFPLPSALRNMDADYRFVIDYSGDDANTRSTSQEFTVRVTRVPTRVLLAPADQRPGATAVFSDTVTSYQVTVDAAGPQPTGVVQLTRNGKPFATGAVTATGTVRVSARTSAASSGTVEARFLPDEDRFVQSSTEIAQDWVAAPVVVTLDPGQPQAGRVSAVTVSVRYAHEANPLLLGDALPAHAPQGSVVVDDGRGATCTAFVGPRDGDGDRTASGACNLTFGDGGYRVLTATYLGADNYAPGSGAAFVEFDRSEPTVSLAVGQNERWGGLTTVPVSWSVAGPRAESDLGTVEIRRGDTVVCTAAVLRGTCQVTLPAYQRTNDDALFTLDYSGTKAWKPATVTRQGQIVACVPFAAPTVSPAGSANVELVTAPDCAGGTGYFESTPVFVRVTAGEKYDVDDVAVNGVSIGSTVGQFVNPPVSITGPNTLRPLTVTATTSVRCIPVVLSVQNYDGAVLPSDALRYDVRGKCGYDVKRTGDRVETMAAWDSDFTVSIDRSKLRSREQFVGWGDGTQLIAGDGVRADSVTVKVTPDTAFVSAAVGPKCYALPEISQPSGGTITIDTPSNCYDRVTDKAAYRYGTTVVGTLKDAGPGAKTYFASWAGSTDRYSAITESNRPTGSRRFSFSIGDRPFTIGATYGTCVSLSTSMVGDLYRDAKVDIQTPGNCPAVGGSASSPWYISGTAVTMEATGGSSGLSFLGWAGLPVKGSATAIAKVTAVLTADTSAVAAYGKWQNCKRIDVSSQPAGALDVGLDFGPQGNPCDVAYKGVTARFYDQGTQGGQEFTVNASPVSAAAQGATIVWASRSNTLADAGNGSTAKEDRPVTTLWQEGSSLSQKFHGDSAVVARACEFASISARILSPSGVELPDLSATNQIKGSPIEDYISTAPADCGVGGNPRYTRGGYAWLAGTDLQLRAAVDPEAFSLVTWEGDASGTGTTPDASVVLSGPGRTAGGDVWHKKVTATFKAKCYTLSLPHDTQRLTVMTPPNCPGDDQTLPWLDDSMGPLSFAMPHPTTYRYLGGTDVVVRASTGGDPRFRHWTSGADSTSSEDGEYAGVHMSSDKALVAYYSSTSIAEDFKDFGDGFVMTMSTTAKVMTGFATAAAGAYVRSLTSVVGIAGAALSATADVLTALNVSGKAVDGIRSAGQTINSVVDMLAAPFDCLTAYSAGGDDTMLFAMQNFVGGGIALGATYGTQTTTAFGTSTRFTKMVNSVESALIAAEPTLAGVSATGLAIKATVAASQAKAKAAKGGRTAAGVWTDKAGTNAFAACMQKKMSAGLDTLAYAVTFGDGSPPSDAAWMKSLTPGTG
ncbi:hypothetical protein CH252_11715 [Rhodococcus sp. 06-1477-1B]|nr:hypothetical protein CH252_11715 [Rhodococcus sp. 06-1477-1B]